MEDRQWLGVKELADTVGVSRQTLIYYDSIDLFKPEFIDTNGYRKYSTSQIMELREILFLKIIMFRWKLSRRILKRKVWIISRRD
ncbi:MAG: MerR family DNA-binding transcriptional regulator [Eubacterium ramulus]